MSEASNRSTIAIFYGSSTCYTEIASEKIQAEFGNNLVDIFNIESTPIINAEFYRYVILGIPTWDYGELQEDWEDNWDEIDQVDWSGRKVALFGLGDQIGYPEWFLDAMGYLHAKVSARGATVCGYWPNQGYEFEDTKALAEDGLHFVGLALDEENQSNQTDLRIKLWCQQLRQEFSL